VCPAELQPQELYWFAKAKDFGKAQEYHLFDCIDCGACSYVCPSHIPLVQYYRFAKSEIWEREKEADAANLARERHEFRQARIERDKQEKADKLAQKERIALAAKAAAPTPVPMQIPAAASLQADTSPEDTMQIRIDAAVARAKEQVAASPPKNTDTLTPEQQAEITEIEARRAQIREMAHPEAQDEKE
jgi:electron transport complex protein RnfC